MRKYKAWVLTRKSHSQRPEQCKPVESTKERQQERRKGRRGGKEREEVEGKGKERERERERWPASHSQLYPKSGRLLEEEAAAISKSPT